MQIGKKPVKDWERILLDTGVILALLAKKDTDDRIGFIKKLVNYLCTSKTGDSKNRLLYISTISLGEILTSESGQEKIKRVLKALDSENVEFLSFDTLTALEFNIRMQPYLERQKVHAIAQKMGFVTQDYGMARQWISKDYMIAMTGFVKGVDVILTIDKNTFYPVCQDFKTTECILTYPELFDHSDKFILGYHYDKVDEFLHPPRIAKKVDSVNIDETPVIKMPRMK